MPNFTTHMAVQFIKRSLVRQAIDDDEVLWAKCDQPESSCEIELILRENLDGAGDIKKYLLRVEEME